MILFIRARPRSQAGHSIPPVIGPTAGRTGALSTARMPAIFFARQVDGVRSLPPRAAADAIQDAAQVAARTKVGRAQAPYIQRTALVRVEGIRPFLYTPERGYAANQTWLPRDPRTGQQGRALGRERARSTEPGSLHTACDAGEQRVSRPHISRWKLVGGAVVAPPGCRSWPGRSARGRRSPPVDRQHCHRHSAPHSRRLTPRLVAFCTHTPAHDSCVAA